MRDTRRTRLVLGLLLLAALTFVVLDLRAGEGGPLQPIRSAAATVFGPLERAAATVFGPVVGFFGDIGSLGDKDAQIEQLRRENEQLRADANTYAADKARADQLDALLRVAGAGQYRTVPAQVIAVGPAQGFAWTVTIDAGEQDGIAPEMTVINGDGLVGRVVTVGPDTATVVLLVDTTTSIGARIAGSQEIGILSGTGRQDVMELQLLDPLAPVEPGDRLVTFGSRGGRPYAPGIPIGEITEVAGTPGQLTRVATVRPFVNVSALDLVGVVTEPPRTDPRDSVLPPVPTPSATPSPAQTPSTEPGATATDGTATDGGTGPEPSPSGG